MSRHDHHRGKVHNARWWQTLQTNQGWPLFVTRLEITYWHHSRHSGSNQKKLQTDIHKGWCGCPSNHTTLHQNNEPHWLLILNHRPDVWHSDLCAISQHLLNQADSLTVILRTVKHSWQQPFSSIALHKITSPIPSLVWRCLHNYIWLEWHPLPTVQQPSHKLIKTGIPIEVDKIQILQHRGQVSPDIQTVHVGSSMAARVQATQLEHHLHLNSVKNKEKTIIVILIVSPIVTWWVSLQIIPATDIPVDTHPLPPRSLPTLVRHRHQINHQTDQLQIHLQLSVEGAVFHLSLC